MIYDFNLTHLACSANRVHASSSNPAMLEGGDNSKLADVLGGMRMEVVEGKLYNSHLPADISRRPLSTNTRLSPIEEQTPHEAIEPF